MTPDVPALWLRYHCPCPACRDPVTGQRLLSITDIPNDPAMTVTAHTPAEIAVTFAPDGHRAAFRRDWPAEQAVGRAAQHPGRAPPVSVTRPQ